MMDDIIDSYFDGWIGFVIILVSICLISFAIGVNFAEDKKQELTYSQRRDIAITFMCTEHNNWKGAKNFCGSLPLDSDRDKK